ncbi:MAG: selenium-dependent molybdenum cofactor biosynthesis protein YqeB [Tissierellia bacterium]|nr:selenium-dependent molybdenum cofactor biosynthesis protein YqeB [Tissierellia bacterium]
MPMKKIVVRGGGDVATGSIQKLYRAGFKVIVLEMERPLCIRRSVALSEAVYEGSFIVEDIEAVKVESLNQINSVLDSDKIPILIDPDGKSITEIKPFAVIDATLSKRNIGMSMDMAELTIALGPGYEAGKDVNFVIETNRGHDLGRIIFEGSAQPNTHMPGNIHGYTQDRVYYSPVESIIRVKKDIRSKVKTGEIIALANDIKIVAKVDGIVRGMVRDGTKVDKNVKIADIDPRPDAMDYCFSISDKARNIGGGTLEAIMIGLNLSKINYQNDNSHI